MDVKREEVQRRFYKNLRKAMHDNRENVSNGGPAKTTPGRSVKFDSHVMETSLGGTQSLGRVKFNDSVLSCMSLNSSSSSTALSEESPSKGTNKDLALSRKPAEDGYDTPVKQPRLQPLREEVAATPECFHPVSFETPLPKSKQQQNVSMHEKDGEEDNSSVTVAVRCRPFSKRELAEPDEKCVISMQDNMTVVTTDTGATHKFSYDYSFWSFDQLGGLFASQEHVYNALAQPLLGKAFEGYNVCLFAYGQTGSGKSYSIMGHGNEQGIIPRFCEDLFGRVGATADDEQGNINVEISFFEIYNEKIHDLLGQTHDKLGRKTNLKVREHPVLGPFVEGLSSYVVKNFDDVNGWLTVGNKHRATAATAMNDKSSRSHSVFTMVLTQTKDEQVYFDRLSRRKRKRKTEVFAEEEHKHSITSKINLVDLAGSERQSLARTSGDRLKEGSSINKSLLTLGKVISLLAERSQSTTKKVYIPYRDSVLTWLLKESLGGNSNTAMLATISPAAVHMEETLSTLRYAQQASKIVNLAKVNEDPTAKLHRELRAEIERLRKLATGVVSEDVIGPSGAEIESLRQQLLEKEKQMEEMTKSWQERLKQSEERRTEEAKQLEKSGISFKVDNDKPNLVNLSEDALLSETLLYILKDGLTRVGRMTEGSKLDIQLRGPLIEENHCTLTNYENTISIKPTGDAPTYVNGNLITGPTVLHHGDRVILGGDHYFRFNHPGELMDRRSLALATAPGGALGIRDFEFARQELVQVQNDKLQAELEKVKLEAELERQKSEAKQAMVKDLERKKVEAEEELNQQQQKHEEKMRKLEQAFKQESAQDKARAKEEIERLRHEKMVLERGILGKRKSLEEEAEAAQRAVMESRQSHSRIVEALELEKQKIVAHVERLQAQRNAQGKPLPGLGILGKIPICDGVKKDTLKILVLLREANKIAQYFKKDVILVREDVEDDKDAEPMVRVKKRSLDISTFWTMAKFESRLLQLREIYLSSYNNGDVAGDELDEIFNDPNDTWEKEDRLFDIPMKVSPRVRTSQSRKNTVAQVAMRLSVGSGSPASPANIKLTATPTAPNKEVLENNTSNINNKTARVPVIGICRELIALSLDNFKGAVLEETLADKVLVHCELVKTGVTNILDAYNKALDSKSKELFLTSEVVRIGSIQISCSLRQLLTLCGLWTSSNNGHRSVMRQSLCDGLMAAVRHLGSHLALFLQGCENDVDKLVQSSASQLLTSLLSLCQHGGELALATDVRVTVLNERAPSLEEEEETRLVLSDQIKQDVLSGCDKFVDKTIQAGVKLLEDCETRIRSIVDELNTSSCEEQTESSLYSDVEVLVSSAKVLLQKCQSIQVELDCTLRDNWEARPDRYYHQNYHRCAALVQHTSNLAEKLNTLVHDTSNRYSNKEEGSLRKIYRTVEMTEKSCESLVTKATQEVFEGDSQDAGNDVSVLNDHQMDVIEIAGQDLQVAAKALREKVKKIAIEAREVNTTPRKEDTTESKTVKNTHNSEQKTSTPSRRKLPRCPEDSDHESQK